MSQVCISYSSLKNASSEAKQVAKKLDKYADNLNSQVYKKITGYGGNHSSNVTSAQSKVQAKINDLRSRETAYNNYAQDLSELREQCEKTDKAVRTRVSSLTSSFKKANGIRDSKAQNVVSYLFTSIGNSSSAGRWLGNKKDNFKSGVQYVRDRVKTWWDYEGGAELVKGIAIGVLEVVLAVCAIVGAVLSGGALIVIIAGVVGGLIALANGVCNIINEKKAYDTTRNGDPATGRRRSEINTWQDYLRSSFVYGDDGEAYAYNPKLYAIATGIDVVNFVCTAITFVSGISELLKNAYKWTTGSMADIKNLKLKDILTKDNFKAFGSKLSDTFKNGFKDISAAFKSHDFAKIGEFMYNFGDDFMNNLKKGYTFKIFEEDAKFSQYLKHGVKLVSNYGSIGKTLISNDFSLKSIVIDVGIEKIAFKNIDVAKITTYEGGNGGVFSYDISGINISDIKGGFTDTFDTISSLGDVVGKLLEKNPVSIQIPEINMPDLSGINVRVAA